MAHHGRRWAWEAKLAGVTGKHAQSPASGLETNEPVIARHAACCGALRRRAHLYGVRAHTTPADFFTAGRAHGRSNAVACAGWCELPSVMPMGAPTRLVACAHARAGLARAGGEQDAPAPHRVGKWAFRDGTGLASFSRSSAQARCGPALLGMRSRRQPLPEMYALHTGVVVTSDTPVAREWLRSMRAPTNGRARRSVHVAQASCAAESEMQAHPSAL